MPFAPKIHVDGEDWDAATVNSLEWRINAAVQAETLARQELEAALSAAVANLSVYRGNWGPDTAYKAGQLVTNPSGQIVSAKVDFRSGTSYVKANWNDADMDAFRGPFAPSTDYAAGDVVAFSGMLYQSKLAFVSTSGFDPVDWSLVGAPEAPVQSINGKVGAVALAASDVGAPTIAALAGEVADRIAGDDTLRAELEAEAAGIYATLDAAGAQIGAAISAEATAREAADTLITSMLVALPVGPSLTPTTIAQNTIVSQSSNARALTLQAAPAQSEDTQTWLNSTGTPVARISPDGTFYPTQVESYGSISTATGSLRSGKMMVTSGVYDGAADYVPGIQTSDLSPMLIGSVVGTGSDGRVGLRVRANGPGQTAPLQTWESENGSAVASIAPDGALSNTAGMRFGSLTLNYHGVFLPGGANGPRLTGYGTSALAVQNQEIVRAVAEDGYINQVHLQGPIKGGDGSSAVAKPNVTPLRVQGATAQTALLTQWLDGAGTIMAYVDPSGGMFVDRLESYGQVDVDQGGLRIFGRYTPLVIGAGSEDPATIDRSNRGLEIVQPGGDVSFAGTNHNWTDQSGYPAAQLAGQRFKLFGGYETVAEIGGSFMVGTPGKNPGGAYFAAAHPNHTPIVARLSPGSAAPIQEWQDSAGNPLAAVDAAGKVTVKPGTAASHAATKGQMEAAIKTGVSWKVGNWYAIVGTSGTGPSANGTGQIAPIAVPPGGGRIDRIGIEVTTAGTTANRSRLCVYSDDNGYPGSLLYESPLVPTDVVGLASVTCDVAVPGGRVWLMEQSMTAGFPGASVRRASATRENIASTSHADASAMNGISGYYFNMNTAAPAAATFPTANVFRDTTTTRVSVRVSA